MLALRFKSNSIWGKDYKFYLGPGQSLDLNLTLPPVLYCWISKQSKPNISYCIIFLNLHYRAPSFFRTLTNMKWRWSDISGPGVSRFLPWAFKTPPWGRLPWYSCCAKCYPKQMEQLSKRGVNQCSAGFISPTTYNDKEWQLDWPRVGYIASGQGGLDLLLR